jgi:hypothetical protein
MGMGAKHPPMKITGQSLWRALWVSLLLSLTNHAHAEKSAEATSAQRVGTEPWVIRDHFVKAYPSLNKIIHYVYFYQLEKKASLTPGALIQANNNPVPRLKAPWRIAREDANTLAESLKKFNEWSEVAEKNRVPEVHKEIASLPSRYQVLYFHREKEAGGTKSWLIVTNSISKKDEYKLSGTDVSALVELLGKLPALDAQVLDKTEPKKPTDALFK